MRREKKPQRRRETPLASARNEWIKIVHLFFLFLLLCYSKVILTWINDELCRDGNRIDNRRLAIHQRRGPNRSTVTFPFLCCCCRLCYLSFIHWLISACRWPHVTWSSPSPTKTTRYTETLGNTGGNYQFLNFQNDDYHHTANLNALVNYLNWYRFFMFCFFLFYQSGARWKRIVTVSWERTNHFNDNSWWLSQLNGWLKSLICGRLEENGLQLFEQSGRWLLVGPITALSFSVIYWSLEFGGGGGGGHHSTVMFGPQPGQPTNKSWSHLLSLFWPEIGRIFNWDLSQINVVNVQSRSEFNAMNSTKNPIHWQKLLKIEQESATAEDFCENWLNISWKSPMKSSTLN